MYDECLCNASQILHNSCSEAFAWIFLTNVPWMFRECFTDSARMLHICCTDATQTLDNAQQTRNTSFTSALYIFQMINRCFTDAPQTLHLHSTDAARCNASAMQVNLRLSSPPPLKRSLREVRKRSLGFWKRSERGLLNASQNASQMFHRYLQHVLQTGLFGLLEKLSNRSNRPLLELHSDLFQVSFRPVPHESIADSSARNRSEMRSERGLKEV